MQQHLAFIEDAVPARSVATLRQGPLDALTGNLCEAMSAKLRRRNRPHIPARRVQSMKSDALRLQMPVQCVGEPGCLLLRDSERPAVRKHQLAAIDAQMNRVAAQPIFGA